MICKENVWLLPQKIQNWKFFTEMFACPKWRFSGSKMGPGKVLGVDQFMHLVPKIYLRILVIAGLQMLILLDTWRRNVHHNLMHDFINILWILKGYFQLHCETGRLFHKVCFDMNVLIEHIEFSFMFNPFMVLFVPLVFARYCKSINSDM